MKGIPIVLPVILGSFLLMGFDLSRSSIPKDDILSGGPPKDGIPALDNPKFLKAGKAGFLKSGDRVLGFVHKGIAKAYPIKILNWHEVVNDRVGGLPVVITYCPLCGTGMAFDPVLDGKTFTFGVSGLLYQSDVLMYDRQTESLWSQIMQEAVTGEMMGKHLTLLTLIHTTWAHWREEHPKTLVLSTDTGYSRNYHRDPYEHYASSQRLMFPVGDPDKRIPPKDLVFGIRLNKVKKAYPFTELQKGPGRFSDTIGSQKVTVHFDKKSRTARIKDSDEIDLPGVVAYWFAWSAFHPKTEVYRQGGTPSPKDGNQRRTLPPMVSPQGKATQ